MKIALCENISLRIIIWNMCEYICMYYKICRCFQWIKKFLANISLRICDITSEKHDKILCQNITEDKLFNPVEQYGIH